jgi:hypothetical protein
VVRSGCVATKRQSAAGVSGGLPGFVCLYLIGQVADSMPDCPQEVLDDADRDCDETVPRGCSRL